MRQSRDEKEREAERKAHAKLVDDTGRAAWSNLLKELRAANPSQKIEYDIARNASWMYVRALTIDGTAVEVRLEQERSDTWSHLNKPVMRRFYFTIGAWSRHRTRPRVVGGKKGFDWARACQLIEAERLRVIRDTETEAAADAAEKAAEKQLKAMFKRRPELRAVKDLVEISYGKFNVEMRGLDLQHAEISLSVALRARQKEGE